MSQPQDLPPLTPPDKDTRGDELIAATLSLTIWGALFVFARLYVRLAGRTKLGWDDLFLALSMVRSERDNEQLEVS
jgi:hypothetical protein